GLLTSGQKTLPTKYLYDEVGSALFDAITALPEYGLTRADLRLLRAHSPDIARLCPDTSMLTELGSGNGSKTRALMESLPPGVVYRPIDLSVAALDRCRRECADFPVQPVEADFLAGLEIVAGSRGSGRLLVAFLGSNIGNFARSSIVPFLSEIQTRLEPGDSFLIGVDLLKSVAQLTLAYDDPAGVTAAFNRNLLSRINRQLNANFRVACFDHEARWNPAERRMEAYLRARSDQHVTFGDADIEVAIRAGDTIWTESSHKFDTAEIIEMAHLAGLTYVESWVDTEWPFAEILFRV
ncbi:MAG: L-histidine N(alpha)-methyltransferase, partial [Bryobacteraceae bacterium]|nr:L-histidine N(alpha)-methyltransferase [Bryobacteraceae bacterium]